MTGQPTLVATSITLMIFSPYTSPSAPPNTVASWLNTATGLPSIVPVPVTTPSPNGPALLHAEVRGAVPGEGVELHEGAGVEQHLQSLAGGVAALGVLALGRLRVGLQGRVAPVEVGELARGGVEIGLGVLP